MSFGMSYGQRSYISEYYDDWIATASPNTVSAYCVLFVLSVYYALYRSNFYPLLSGPELLWNCMVYITPWSVVSALDKDITTKPEGGGASFISRTFAAKNEAMRRILGLDGTGLLTNIQRVRSLSGISSVLKTTQNSALAGLGNWDNSCYQNSIIQGLASLPTLSNFLTCTPEASRNNPSSTSQALKEVIDKLNDPSNAGRRLWTPPELKSMSSWQQQDAQEYYSKILEEIEEETSKNSRPVFYNAGLSELRDLGLGSYQRAIDTAEVSFTESSRPFKEMVEQRRKLSQLPEELSSIISRNPLEGLLAQRVGCLQCGYVEGLSLVTFNCLTVPLGKQWVYDIRSCMDEYTALESITGVECAKCTLLRQKKQLEALHKQSQDTLAESNSSASPKVSEALLNSINTRLDAVNEALENEDFSENTLLKKCQIPGKSRVSTTKTRQAVIARAPTSLVLHVNRSIFNETTGMQSKNYAEVKFPARFDLDPWCLGGLKKSEGGNQDVESWNTDPSASMLSEEEVKTEEATNVSFQRTYVLRAVVTHYGRHENGHYICYRRNPEKDDEISDSDVWWRLSDDDVSKVNEKNVMSQGGVFMLFYEMVGDRKSVEVAEISKPSHNTAVPEFSLALDDALVGKVPDDTRSVSASDISQDRSIAALESDDGFNPQPTLSDPNPLWTSQMPSPKISPNNSTDPDISSTDLEDNTVAVAKELSRSLANSTITGNKGRQLHPPMRTAGARDKRGSVSGPGKAMTSISSMVAAN